MPYRPDADGAYGPAAGRFRPALRNSGAAAAHLALYPYAREYATPRHRDVRGRPAGTYRSGTGRTTSASPGPTASGGSPPGPRRARGDADRGPHPYAGALRGPRPRLVRPKRHGQGRRIVPPPAAGPHRGRHGVHNGPNLAEADPSLLCGEGHKGVKGSFRAVTLV
ncbi:hypothetical protein ACFP4F_02090 [Streptomyces ochraceiscleroticus]|uniref:Uncharacterized protein n=1 Tax=Streptomyces ochraceiscleroticus TaxID=47761 RepID=A0ABW1MC29_9ACTN|nr:hypothetical protein [Streptomyces ochraceiscleroticus]